MRNSKHDFLTEGDDFGGQSSKQTRGYGNGSQLPREGLVLVNAMDVSGLGTWLSQESVCWTSVRT